MRPPHRQGPDPTRPGRDDPSLGTTDLTDRELADALWFAAVRAKAEDRSASRDADPGDRWPETRTAERRNGDSPSPGPESGKPPLDRIGTNGGKGPGDTGQLTYREGRPEASRGTRIASGDKSDKSIDR